MVSNVDIWSQHVTINFKMMISCDNILGWVGVGTIDQQRFVADAFHERVGFMPADSIHDL